jgi:hypothetical protein
MTAEKKEHPDVPDPKETRIQPGALRPGLDMVRLVKKIGDISL